MIPFTRFQLSNGLRVIIHEDRSTPMVAVNVLYDVGARDEMPERTGFAHLFEHLMFGGSANAPDYDEYLQRAGGESNAYTNQDVTHFYNTLPAENIELALWLESDRMHLLNCDERSLDVQRKVVVEEFKETCLNEPYGDVWHHLGDLAYTSHPYRWPTIGRVPQHIEEAAISEVRAFYQQHYCPNNAILVVAGNTDEATARPLIEKWFAKLATRNRPARNLTAEPEQTASRRRCMKALVPGDAIYLAFRMCDRLHPDFYTCDLLSDILGNGTSARLYRRLLKEKELFSEIDCYVTATLDPGLLVVEGKPADGVSIEEARTAIWAELKELQEYPISKRELEKHQNKFESSLTFSEMNIQNKAINLALFELLGDANLINQEVALYRAVRPEDVQRMARQLFREENCSELVYERSLAST